MNITQARARLMRSWFAQTQAWDPNDPFCQFVEIWTHRRTGGQVWLRVRTDGVPAPIVNGLATQFDEEWNVPAAFHPRGLALVIGRAKGGAIPANIPA